MTSTSSKAFDAFRGVVERSGEFKERSGQIRMAQIVSDTLSRGDLHTKDSDKDNVGRTRKHGNVAPVRPRVLQHRLTRDC